MIIYIEQCDREHNRELLKQYYQLRKKIFCDQYGWVTANPDGTETDHLDEGYNIFVLYVDPATNQVAGRCETFTNDRTNFIAYGLERHVTAPG